ncbi:histone deacetylase 14 [Tanacetum coccineum]
MGPCFAGNVAIAARYAQRAHGLKRVLIIDFDAHHGKSTNDVFYDDPDVFFLSIHQDEITGKIDDIGRENGVGATLNVPLPGFSGDIAMQIVFNNVIRPCALKFKPDIILVSAGYNGHVQDRSSDLQWRTRTYNLLASGIKELAMELRGGRCVFFLEGGGDNLESLSDSVAESFRAFIGEPSNSVELDIRHFVIQEPLYSLMPAILKIRELHHL